MKIEIKNKRKKKDWIPKLKDLVQHVNGKIGIIVNININNTLKIVVLSAFEDEEGNFDHSKVIVEWTKDSIFPFEGTITISNE